MTIMISALAYDNGESGISKYIDEVIHSLDTRREYIIILNQNDYQYFEKNDRLSFFLIPPILSFPIFSVLFSFFILPFIAWYYKVDSLLLLAANRRLTAYNFVNTIAVIHDLSQFHIPCKYGALRMFYIKQVIPLFLANCSHVHCVSKSTYDDVVKYYKIPTIKLTINHLGYSAKISNLGDKQKRLKKNILYVARLEHPGKNHIGLLRAFALLPENVQRNNPLVFVGALWGGHEEIMAEIDRLDLCRKVTVKGRVSAQALDEEYKAAKLFAFPSFYEGFGIPLLEAMDYDIPVICSNVSSLPEIGGDAVIHFNPHDPVEMEKAIQNVLTDNEIANGLIKKGRIRIQQFSWKKHTDGLMEACNVN